MLKIKVGDKVKITSGKDKGREGSVERILAAQKLAVVPDINIYKKHVKGRPGQKGGIFDIPRPLPFAKLMVICPKCKKTARMGFRVVGSEKVRVCKVCGKEIESK